MGMVTLKGVSSEKRIPKHGDENMPIIIPKNMSIQVKKESPNMGTKTIVFTSFTCH